MLHNVWDVVSLAEIILSWMSIIFFIMRIDKTIKAVEEINSGNGIYFLIS